MFPVQITEEKLATFSLSYNHILELFQVFPELQGNV